MFDTLDEKKFLLKELVKSGKTVPRFYMACGESDFLYQAFSKP